MDRNVLFAGGRGRRGGGRPGIAKLDPERTGVIGSAIGGIGIVEEQQRILLEKGPDRVSATFLPNCLVDTATSYIATKLGVVGLNFAVVSAYATGSHAIGEAAELHQAGKADADPAGGTEARITPRRSRLLPLMRRPGPGARRPRRRPRAPTTGPGPFVIAEGAAVVLLESEAYARARGAKVYAEVAGQVNDAYYVATPHPESRGVIHMLNDAPGVGEVRPQEVDYINAHGTGTLAWRPGRDAGHPPGLRRPRRRAGRLLHQVDDRSPVRRPWARLRGDRQRARPAHQSYPDHQLRDRPACDLDYG